MTTHNSPKIVANTSVPPNALYLVPPLPTAVRLELEKLEAQIGHCCGVIYNISAPEGDL
jgi:hypothetical protein